MKGGISISEPLYKISNDTPFASLRIVAILVAPFKRHELAYWMLYSLHLYVRPSGQQAYPAKTPWTLKPFSPAQSGTVVIRRAPAKPAPQTTYHFSHSTHVSNTLPITMKGLDKANDASRDGKVDRLHMLASKIQYTKAASTLLQTAPLEDWEKIISPSTCQLDIQETKHVQYLLSSINDDVPKEEEIARCAEAIEV
ncbi:uncharacterized protein BDR25DRAFT_349766 [Lindgomyces ingoldianus]|uniref:Uncharacterized protein n=1 Tax=Lindgomyces ingoldianus TaxID=673940 RepID=A0ACB6RBP9_9PLEO|nr:uncharacterized protein BDR25DRAFT_349766 [Lindgomyces ingoldianus]KAF2476699.1 hypothetical protein BDR25DRAFT_349766 [Lindgomyces ingoldianus]